jgi:hypothetical protein
MSLIITKITAANSNIEFNYLGSEHVWGLILTANYDFSIHDARMEDGDTLLEGIDALQEAYIKPNIAAKIGIDEFRNGEITSLNLPDSSRAGITTASISITERIKLDSDDGVLYDLTQNIPSPQDIESFSETFTFSRSQNSYSYNRNLSLKYRQDTASDFLNKAYLFMKLTYLNSRPSFGFQEDGISEFGRFDLRLKPLISETYDLLNKQIDLTESFSSNRIETKNGITFSKKSTHKETINPKGFTEKSFDIEIKALGNPVELNLNSGIKMALDDVLSENTGEYGIPNSIEKTITKDSDIGVLSVNFSNDPSVNSMTSINYTANKQRTEFDNYSFALNVTSKGPNKTDSFDKSVLFLKNNTGIAFEKIPILFPEVSAADLNEVSRSVDFNPFKSSVSQTISLTDNPNYKDDDDGILKRSISVSDNNQIDRDTVIPIIGDKEFIIRNQNKTLGSRDISAEVVSTDQNGVEQAIQVASGFAPDSTYKYLTSKSTSEDILNNKTTASLNFSFFD